MRAVLLAAMVLALAAPALAKERPTVPRGVPSIMVDPDAPAASKATARKAAASRKVKPPVRTVRRSPALPVPSTGGAGLAGINRSLDVQGQQMRAQDQRQFELNQIRSGSGGSLGCAPGSLGC
jgi:hypothetical protein